MKSTLAFNLLLLTVWVTFLLLGIAYILAQSNGTGMPDIGLTRAGGAVGIVAAFLAWYNMYAGIADSSNSFLVVPVVHCKLSDVRCPNLWKCVLIRLRSPVEREGKERQEEGDGEWKRRIIKSIGIQFAGPRDPWYSVDFVHVIWGLYKPCSLDVDLNRAELEVRN